MRRHQVDQNQPLLDFKRVCTGLCFIIFPAIWVFGFAVHPNLLEPRLLLGPADLIRRAHGDGLLQFAHALVTVNTAVFVVVALHYMKLLEGTASAWAGVIGAGLAIFGACMLAADKGAMCLTMSAVDTVPETEFARMMPGLVAVFSFKGWVALVWGLLLMPIGVLIQTVGMFRVRALPRWQLGLLFVGILFIGFPDGAEIINLTAAALMGAAMIPYGVRLMRGGTGEARP
jgi:hypothetical protein